MAEEHRYQGIAKDGMLRSAQNLAAWRHAFVVAGFSDKEALRLVRDVWNRGGHQTSRLVTTGTSVPNEKTEEER